MSVPKIDVVKFFKAINAGDFYTVDLGIQGGLKVDSLDKDGWTAAGRAVQKNRSGVLKVMFDHGLDAKLSGSGGVTLLHVAALANRPLMCQMLLREGADPSAKNLAGLSPIDSAASPEVKTILQAAATEGLPPALPDSEFEEGEQAYCLDKNGMWWPAVVFTKKPGGWYEVHFPGYGRREDVTVKCESLLKISLSAMRQLESERRRLEVEHAAKRPNKPSSKRRPNTAEDDDDDDEEEPQARTKAQPKRRKSSAQLMAGPSRLLDNYDDILLRLQEQRELVADFGVRNGDADAKLQAQDVELNRLRAQVQDALAAVEAQRKELSKKDKEVKMLQAELVRQKKQSTPDLSGGSMPPSITGYGKKGDVDKGSLRQIAVLSARVQQLEAESSRYERLLKQYQPSGHVQRNQLTNMSKPGDESQPKAEAQPEPSTESPAHGNSEQGETVTTEAAGNGGPHDDDDDDGNSHASTAMATDADPTPQQVATED